MMMITYRDNKKIYIHFFSTPFIKCEGKKSCSRLGNFSLHPFDEGCQKCERDTNTHTCTDGHKYTKTYGRGAAEKSGIFTDFFEANLDGII